MHYRELLRGGIFYNVRKFTQFLAPRARHDKVAAAVWGKLLSLKAANPFVAAAAGAAIPRAKAPKPTAEQAAREAEVAMASLAGLAEADPAAAAAVEQLRASM